MIYKEQYFEAISRARKLLEVLHLHFVRLAIECTGEKQLHVACTYLVPHYKVLLHHYL